ncbi:MAG: hypothetical protein JSR55_08720 [Proteobacteria bacterium]|nr:hypothetical protein [Pseudomonadota bacterium]
MAQIDHSLVALLPLATGLRDNPWLSAGAAALYALLYGIRKFFAAIDSVQKGIPVARRAGVSDVMLKRMLTALIFYMVFLFYQLIQSPYTLYGGAVATWTDVVVQSVLAALIIGNILLAEANLFRRWHGDESYWHKRRKVQEIFDGRNMRYLDIVAIIPLALVVNFGPALYIWYVLNYVRH